MRFVPRTVYNEEHAALSDSVKRFLEREVAPFYSDWEKRGFADRDLWHKAGAAGLLGMTVPEVYGGPGGTLLHAAVFVEELSRSGYSLPGIWTHSDIIVPYITRIGTEEQKQLWLPKCCSGEVVTSIAMTEPGAGSDLKSIKTKAVRCADGYKISGQKTFITNGHLCDLMIVVADLIEGADSVGTSLFLVESERSGFSRGRVLEKVGQKAQDTAELFFDDVFVPDDNLLGEAGKGFQYLMAELPQERLVVALAAIAAAETVLEETVSYTKERKAFGDSIFGIRTVGFELADMAADLVMARVFADRCLELANSGALSTVAASMAKLKLTELLGSVADKCVQLHGGYGYMWEYPVARAFADARGQRIYAGTNEIMKLIISRNL